VGTLFTLPAGGGSHFGRVPETFQLAQAGGLAACTEVEPPQLASFDFSGSGEVLANPSSEA